MIQVSCICQTNASHSVEAVDKIGRELDRLRLEPIGAGELELVKNYEFGNMLRSFDGVFSMMDRYVETGDAGLSDDFWTTYFARIPLFSAEELRELAFKYLETDSMTEIVVG